MFQVVENALKVCKECATSIS